MNFYRYNKRVFSNIYNKENQGDSVLYSEGKRIFSVEFNEDRRPSVTQIDHILSRQGYRKTASRPGENGEEKIFYEKAKLSIFGSYLVHLAVTVLLLAGIVTAWGGEFYDFFIQEGETTPLKGTNTLLTLEKFSVIPSSTKEKAEEYASRLRINRPDKSIEWQTLKVNSPLRIEGIRLYQSRFNLDIEKLKVAIFQGSDRQPIKILNLDINRKITIPELNMALEVKDFIPDFSIDKNYQVSTRSHLMKNPAANLWVYSPPESSLPTKKWIFRGRMPHLESSTAQEGLEFVLDDVQFRYSSGIKYARNPGEFITYFGLILIIGGSFLSTSRFYRGLIVTVKKDLSGLISSLSAQALKCKNIFAFEKEMDNLVKTIQLKTK